MLACLTIFSNIYLNNITNILKKRYAQFNIKINNILRTQNVSVYKRSEVARSEISTQLVRQRVAYMLYSSTENENWFLIGIRS